MSITRGGFYTSSLIALTLVPFGTGLVGRWRATFVEAGTAGLIRKPFIRGGLRTELDAAFRRARARVIEPVRAARR